MNNQYQTDYSARDHPESKEDDMKQSILVQEQLSSQSVFEIHDTHFSQQIHIPAQDHATKMAVIQSSHMIRSETKLHTGEAGLHNFQELGIQNQGLLTQEQSSNLNFSDQKDQLFHYQQQVFTNFRKEADKMKFQQQFMISIPYSRNDQSIKEGLQGYQAQDFSFADENPEIVDEEDQMSDIFEPKREMAPFYNGANLLQHGEIKSFDNMAFLPRQQHCTSTEMATLNSNSRVDASLGIEQHHQFITPVKARGLHQNQRCGYLMSNSDKQNSAQGSAFKNLETLQKAFLPIHIIGSKSTKAKILDYKKQKPLKQEAKSQKHVSMMLTSSGDGKKSSKDVNAQEQNRRVKKVKNKKKSGNRTEPSIRESDNEESCLEKFKQSLNVQTYEISYLNSLNDLNKNLAKLRQQSLSLQGNLDSLDSGRMSLENELSVVENLKERDESKTQKNTNPDLEEKRKNFWVSKNIGKKYVTFKDQQPPFPIASFADIKPYLTLQATYNQQPSLSQKDKRSKCSCQKNNCTQGYCDCLKNNQACDPQICGCVGCQNTVDNQALRLENMEKQAKLQVQKEGCNCKNSQCMKGYCECFQNGKMCNPKVCKCISCKNNDQSKQSTRPRRISAIRNTQ